MLGKQLEFRTGWRILIWKLQKGKRTNNYWILRVGGGWGLCIEHYTPRGQKLKTCNTIVPHGYFVQLSSTTPVHVIRIYKPSQQFLTEGTEKLSCKYELYSIRPQKIFILAVPNIQIILGGFTHKHILLNNRDCTDY